MVERETHLLELLRYIHCNPVRAELVANPGSYPYSSYREYIAEDDVELVEKDKILQLFGKRPATQIKRFTEFVNNRKSGSVYEPDKLVRGFRYGDGIIGSDEFGQEIDARMRERKDQ